MTISVAKKLFHQVRYQIPRNSLKLILKPLIEKMIVLIPDATDELNGRARAVRYAKDISLSVTLRDDGEDGQIYPPYFTINYGTATYDDYTANTELQVRGQEWIK